MSLDRYAIGLNVIYLLLVLVVLIIRFSLYQVYYLPLPIIMS